MGSTTPGDQIVTALVSILTALTICGDCSLYQRLGSSYLGQSRHKHQQPRHQRCRDDSHGKGPVVQDCHRNPCDLSD